MNDYGDWLRTLGVNGGVFATVSLVNIELVLKIILLIATIVWTIVKCYKLLTDDEGKTKK